MLYVHTHKLRVSIKGELHVCTQVQRVLSDNYCASVHKVQYIVVVGSSWKDSYVLIYQVAQTHLQTSTVTLIRSPGQRIQDKCQLLVYGKVHSVGIQVQLKDSYVQMYHRFTMEGCLCSDF